MIWFKLNSIVETTTFIQFSTLCRLKLGICSSVRQISWSTPFKPLYVHNSKEQLVHPNVRNNYHLVSKQCTSQVVLWRSTTWDVTEIRYQLWVYLDSRLKLQKHRANYSEVLMTTFSSTTITACISLSNEEAQTKLNYTWSVKISEMVFYTEVQWHSCAFTFKWSKQLCWLCKGSVRKDPSS